MPDIIMSNSNNLVKHVKSLHEKKYRDQNNQYFVEGLRIVRDAIENNANIETIIISNEASDEVNDYYESLADKFKMMFVTEKVFKEMSDTEHPQGIMAVINKKDYSLKDIKTDFIVILDNLQDPGNMGTIIRTADAAGVGGIVVSKGCVDLYNPKVLRSTMGSIFHIPIIKTEDFALLINELNNQKYNIYAAHLNGHNSIYEVNMRSKTAIIIGNEANGVSQDIARKCILVKIPMIGKAESLNASVSGAIIMYEALRQREIEK